MNPAAPPLPEGLIPHRVPWKSVLQLLKSSKDEEKFAGLLMVPKSTRRDEDRARESAMLKEVREAVGIKFIQRILRTPAYRSFALAFVSQLALNSDFAKTKDALSIISVPLVVLALPNPPPGQPIDSFAIVAAIVASQPAEFGSVPGNLIHLARAASAGFLPVEETNYLMERVHDVIIRPELTFNDNDHEALFDVLFPAVSRLLLAQSPSVFSAISTLNLVFGARPQYWKFADSVPASEREKIGAALLQLLSNRLGALQRTHVIAATDRFMRAWGMAWAGTKLGPLAAELAVAEMTVALEYPSKPENEDERIVILANCSDFFMRLFEILVPMDTENQLPKNVPPEVVLKYREPLKTLAGTLIEYLSSNTTDRAEVKAFSIPVLTQLFVLGEVDIEHFEKTVPAILQLPGKFMPLIIPMLEHIIASPLAPQLARYEFPEKFAEYFLKAVPSVLSMYANNERTERLDSMLEFFANALIVLVHVGAKDKVTKCADLVKRAIVVCKDEELLDALRDAYGKLTK